MLKNVSTIFFKKFLMACRHEIEVFSTGFIVLFQLASLSISKVIEFPDTHTYCSFSYFNWHDWFGSSRPFLYPLMIHTLNHNFYAVILVQFFFSIISMIYFYQVVVGFLQQDITKKIFSFLILSYFFSQVVMSWNACILTDSISFSLWFLFFAFFLHYIRDKKLSMIALVVLTSFLLIFIRYYNLLLIIMLLPLCLMVMVKQQARRNHLIAFLLLNMVVCGIGYTSLKLSNSTDYSFKNIISHRGLSQRDQSLVNYFTQYGFPRHSLEGLDYNKDAFVLSHYGHSTEIDQWIQQGGKKYYLPYLIHHPKYLFLMPFFQKLIHKEFSGPYPEESIWRVYYKSFRVHYHYYNLFPVSYFYLLLGFLVFFMINLHRKKFNMIQIIRHVSLQNWFIAFYFGLVATSSMLITWHLEPMEMERHSIFTTFFSILGFILIICSLLDRVGLEKSE